MTLETLAIRILSCPGKIMTVYLPMIPLSLTRSKTPAFHLHSYPLRMYNDLSILKESL